MKRGLGLFVAVVMCIHGWAWSAPLSVSPPVPVSPPITSPVSPEGPYVPETSLPSENPSFTKPIGVTPNVPSNALEVEGAGNFSFIGVGTTFVLGLLSGMLIPWGQKDAKESSLSYVPSHPRTPPKKGMALVGPVSYERLRERQLNEELLRPYSSNFPTTNWGSVRASVGIGTLRFQTASGFIKSIHSYILDCYRKRRTQCSDVAFQVAALLVREGKSPSLFTFQNYLDRAYIAPVAFEEKIRWGKHFAAFSDGLIYDPLLGYPIELEKYSHAVFGEPTSFVVSFPSPDLKEWIENNLKNEALISVSTEREKHLLFEAFLGDITKRLELFEAMIINHQIHIKGIQLQDHWNKFLEDLIDEQILYSREEFEPMIHEVENFSGNIASYPQLAKVGEELGIVLRLLQKGPPNWKDEYHSRRFQGRITTSELLQDELSLNRNATVAEDAQRNYSIMMLEVGHQLFAAAEEGGNHGPLYNKLIQAFEDKGYEGPSPVIAAAYIRFSRRGGQNILTIHGNYVYTTPSTRERIREFMQAKNPSFQVVVDPRISD